MERFGIERGFVRPFLTAVVTVIVLALVYVTVTVPIQLSLGAKPYTIRGMENKIVLAIILEGIVAFVGLILAFYLHRTAKVPYVKYERRIFHSLAAAFFFPSVGALSLIAGQSRMLVQGTSFVRSSLLGMLYPTGLFLAVVNVTMGAYFFMKFGHLYVSRTELPIRLKAPIIALTGATLALSVHPYSWFGMLNPPGTPYLRTVVHALMFATYLLAIGYVISALIRNMRGAPPEKKNRLQSLLIGFVAMLFFFIFAAIDALYGEQYTMWIYLAYFSAVVSFLALFATTVVMR